MSSTFQINIPRHRKHGYCHHESYGKCKFTSIFWKSIRPFFVEFRSKISQCWSSIVVSGWQQNQWTLRKNFWCWHWHSWSRKLGQQWSKRNSVKYHLIKIIDVIFSKEKIIKETFFEISNGSWHCWVCGEHWSGFKHRGCLHRWQIQQVEL